MPANTRAVPDGAFVMTQAMLDALVGAAVSAALAQQQAARPVPADDRPDLPPLLKPAQVKELTGWSLSTVHRMLDEEELPHVLARGGARQRMRQVPKAFVLRMMADLRRGVSIPDMKAYARQWQAENALHPAGGGYAAGVA
jgi:hypothetical protein